MISSELFWQWVTRWWRAILIVLLFFTLIVFYLQSTIIILNVKVASNSQKNTLKITRLNDAGVRGDVFHIGALAVVPRDTARIETTYGKWQTTVETGSLPWIGIESFSISVEPDKNATKVTGGSLGCVTYDKVSNVLASYSCFDPTGLETYVTSDKDGVEWKNQAYLTFPRAYSVTNYKNGLLGISNNKSPQLFYADMSTKAVSLPDIPPGMNTSEFPATSIVTDQIRDTNHFLIVSRQTGTIYFATDTDNSTEYRTFAIDKKWFDSKGVKCTLEQTTAYCYIGWSSADTHSDDEKEAHEETRTNGRLVAIDFSSNKVNYTLSSVSKDEPIDNLYIDENKQLFATSGVNLYSLDMTKSIARRTIVTPSVGAISSGPVLYYIANNKLYEFNSKTKQTTLRFASEHLRLSTINQVDSKVYVNAYVNGIPSNQLHTYELLKEQNTTPGERIIDKLPVALDSDQSPIVSMDFQGNNIHIVLPNYVNFDSAGRIVPEMSVYNTSRQEAINYLSTIIPNIDEYHITSSRASND